LLPLFSCATDDDFEMKKILMFVFISKGSDLAGVRDEERVSYPGNLFSKILTPVGLMAPAPKGDTGSLSLTNEVI
jgi:hypothetical protein